MEPRAADIAHINAYRSARVAAVQTSSQGRLASILGSSHEADRFVYVVKLLDVHPALGKVAGRRLLDSLSLSHFTRVGDLTIEQVTAVLAACQEVA